MSLLWLRPWVSCYFTIFSWIRAESANDPLALYNNTDLLVNYSSKEAEPRNYPYPITFSTYNISLYVIWLAFYSYSQTN